MSIYTTKLSVLQNKVAFCHVTNQGMKDVEQMAKGGKEKWYQEIRKS